MTQKERERIYIYIHICLRVLYGWIANAFVVYSVKPYYLHNQYQYQYQ